MLLLSFILESLFYLVTSQSFAADPTINVKELKCLVCQASTRELDKVMNKIDPTGTIDVGGHRLDVDGNYKRRSVPKSKSELHLSELLETVCDSMDNYIRGKWKSNGTLTLLSMVDESGKMNANFGDIDIIQDDDLNKSLKYNCEMIIEEYEESIIRMYQDEVKDVERKLCIETTKLCPFKFQQVEL